MVHGKLYKSLYQPTLLPLLMDKTEVTEHRHSFNFYDAESTGSQFLTDRADGNDSHAVCVFKKELDTFRTAEIHQHMK